jgi:tetratricopeptide (TPR) repeat protein
MSLLLEALKKAELAKQAAKEQPASTDKPPFTRDKLPDISQPMEINSDDLRPAQTEPAPRRAERRPLELALEEAPRAAPAEAVEPPAPPPPPRALAIETDFAAPSEAGERKQAQQLFEAKEMDVNPRRPFYLTVGALGLFALGTVGYFWYEMQPKNNYKIPPPSAQAAAPIVAAAPAASEPAAAPAAATVTPPTGTSPEAAAMTGAPGTAPAPAPAAIRPGAAQATALRPTPAGSGSVTAARQAAPPRAPRREGDITITPAMVQIDPAVESAYQAFNAGDLVRAREGYEQALRSSPVNRDALLGLAAVEVQARHFDAAGRYYTRLLELDPLDAYAQAGLLGLKGQVDPLAAESRVKTMIAAQPDASFLQFTLGNQYAAQGRWAEAQQAYFGAYSGNPGHPDFAYNLAVSLDQMHQVKPALEYYRRALALAQSRPVTFDIAQVQKRVSQLSR